MLLAVVSLGQPALADVVAPEIEVCSSAPRTAALACSFSGETEVVMADGTSKPISEVEVGDEVLAVDPETGQRGARRVLNLFVHRDTLVDLGIGGCVVTTTEDHPFWNQTDGVFERADALDAGDLVLTADGDLVAVDGFVAGSKQAGMAYNLHIEEIHTYFVVVGDDEALVHNSCPSGLRQATRGLSGVFDRGERARALDHRHSGGSAR